MTEPMKTQADELHDKLFGEEAAQGRWVAASQIAEDGTELITIVDTEAIKKADFS
jgi:hypothetical protein